VIHASSLDLLFGDLMQDNALFENETWNNQFPL